MKIGTQIKIKSVAIHTQLGEVNWISRAVVTKVTATQVDYEIVETLGGTGPAADAPFIGGTGGMALAMVGFLKKHGRLEVLA